MAQHRGGLSNAMTTLAFSLATNALIVIGVVAWNWPAGNVFLLFVLENVATMTLTYLLLLRTTASGSAMGATFFLLHSGLFTLVHTIFTLVIAFLLGVEPSFLSLGLPVALLAVRFGVEAWNLIRATSGVTRPRPPGAVAAAYGRVFALHVGIFPGMFAAMNTSSGSPGAVPFLGMVLTYGQLVVVALMVLKSIADIIVTLLVEKARS